MNKFERFDNDILNNYSENISFNISPSSTFRSRCEFSYSNNSYVMHDKDQRIFMTSFDCASKAIKRKMPILLEEINSSNEMIQNNFENENLNVNFKDYYFSNVIARSSKTMLECNNSKLDFKNTGTDG